MSRTAVCADLTTTAAGRDTMAEPKYRTKRPRWMREQKSHKKQSVTPFKSAGRRFGKGIGVAILPNGTAVRIQTGWLTREMIEDPEEVRG